MRNVLTSSDVVGGKENDGPSPEARYFAVEERVLPFDVARRDVARARTLRHESFGPVPIPNGEIMGKLTRLLPCSLFSACFLASLGAQVPATYQTFGQGCAGSPAVPYLYALKLPVVGREAAIAVQNLTANSLAVLVFGGSNSTWNNQPLPLNLGFLGAGNCNLLVSFDAPLLLSTGSGMAVLVVRIPKDPSAIGATFYNQLFTPDPASNSAGLAASNGAKATIGDCLCLPERSVTEAFADATMLDTEHSGGTWAGGRVVLPKVGGSGRHGVFDHTLGTLQGASTYLWSTDSMRIPGTHTESGNDEIVTDGVFQFSSLRIPAGITVRFTGTKPLVIKVRGEVVIDGTLDASGEDPAFFLAHDGSAVTRVGQAGARGGPGAGSGGQGGDSCLNSGPGQNYDGRHGSDVLLAQGHAYASGAVGTGGHGSPHFPRTGKTSVYCALNNTFAAETAAGGGGGGFVLPGGTGTCTRTPCQIVAHCGTNPLGTVAFDIAALTPVGTGRDVSLRHFAVGGSGGGGGGSHPLLSLSSNGRWLAGSAGAGGGGVIVLRAGRSLVSGTTGVVAARGGSGYQIDSVNRGPLESKDNLFNVPAPGGGGSGGTVLLQVDGTVQLGGSVDAAGGRGGILDNTPGGQPGLIAKARGGDGAPGYLRLETQPAPAPSALGTTIPTAGPSNVGALNDTDEIVASQSRFYRTGLLAAPPLYLRYEIEATVNGKPVLYSDDPGSTHPNYAGAASAGKPVQIRIQGASIDLVSGKVLQLFPWRDIVYGHLGNTLNADVANGFRFQLVFDRRAATTVDVTKVTVLFRE